MDLKEVSGRGRGCDKWCLSFGPSSSLRDCSGLSPVKLGPKRKLVLLAHLWPALARRSPVSTGRAERFFIAATEHRWAAVKSVTEKGGTKTAVCWATLSWEGGGPGRVKKEGSWWKICKVKENVSVLSRSGSTRFVRLTLFTQRACVHR